MDENTPLDQDQDFPSLVFNLEEDPHLNSQLSHFGREKSPAKDVKYRPSEQQLLKEGKLGSSEFTARLQQASFGTFKGETACLVVIKVDFAAKNKGWFRFRRATIEMEVEEPSLSSAKNDEVDEEVSSDDSDEAEYTGPLIRTFYPDLIRGHIQTAAETYNISFELPIPSPAPSGGLSAGWTVTSPRESHHLVHGFLVGSPETRVKWNMNENEISKGGLYEQPVFAIVVRYREEKGFVLGLRMRATTYGGLGVVGKGGARIKFMKTCKGGGDGEGRMGGLTGGSVTVGGKTWNGNADSKSGSISLQEVDLELLTRMRSTLLGEQGPGGGQFDSSLTRNA
ncbi:hypothetical protein OEA41_005783 [Lepraria neglecta]|uniref:Uncharacterized protein n=1 Tax=Lepraria neglecta TaxID=209136 RepID=A0AAD9Z7P5_9LECA|nr:hypothetical protein OEA41_005783 [Lepraria neglecta]